MSALTKHFDPIVPELEQLQRNSAINNINDADWTCGSTSQRCFGQLNISKACALELTENLNFVDECLQEGFAGLALEVAEELSNAFKDSPSLLVKILLRELTEYLKSPHKKSRLTLALNTFNMLILRRCQAH
jgi:hypothetical protein